MLFKLILVLCAIQACLSRCDECKNGYTRIKRAKYYSNPPPRFYRKPPMIYPIRGPFSYTPPPGYMDDGDKNSGPPAPYKVSKRKEGLGEEDFQNLIKYLSKQDLDRIVELAGEKVRHTERFPSSNEQTNVFKNSELDFDPSKIIPFTNDDQKPSNIDYTNPPNYVQLTPESGLDNNQVNPYLETEESQQISYLNSHIQKDFNKVEYQQATQKGQDVIFTDSDSMKEEQLPRPQNLREEADHAASYTNNVPSIVQAQSYKLENFADLPLMNYDHSKLETVNSYSVPHYTVTSSRNQVPPAVPPPSFNVNSSVQTKQASAQQSDAHLKAVKIWTHRSTGTAYTLHDDGTLSLERPLRPTRKF